MRPMFAPRVTRLRPPLLITWLKGRLLLLENSKGMQPNLCHSKSISLNFLQARFHMNSGVPRQNVLPVSANCSKYFTQVSECQ